MYMKLDKNNTTRKDLKVDKANRERNCEEIQ